MQVKTRTPLFLKVRDIYQTPAFYRTINNAWASGKTLPIVVTYRNASTGLCIPTTVADFEQTNPETWVLLRDLRHHYMEELRKTVDLGGRRIVTKAGPYGNYEEDLGYFFSIPPKIAEKIDADRDNADWVFDYFMDKLHK